MTFFGLNKLGRKTNRVCYPEKVGNLRTDSDFKNGNYLGTHQLGTTILKEIPNFGWISQVPLDYMHLVLLGVVKNLISFLMESGPIGVLLTPDKQKILDTRIKDISKELPCELSRPPSINKLSSWKAHDFRTILLYIGPLPFKNLVSDKFYNNFLTLHVAISVLISEKRCKEPTCINYAEELLNLFAEQFKKLYTQKKCSPNVHGLRHLANDARKFGALDNFSAFKFESFIARVKPLLRQGNCPLQQIDRRLSELSFSTEFENDIGNDLKIKNLISRNTNSSGISTFSHLKPNHLRSTVMQKITVMYF